MSFPANKLLSMMSKNNQSDYIQLDQFLKWKNLASSGGEAKHIIREGQVTVNGEVETRRGRKLRNGDRVVIGAVSFEVELGEAGN